METDPTVVWLIVKYKCFGYWSGPEVTLAVAVLEKTLLCPYSVTCSGTWIVLQILFDCETKIKHILVII